MSLDLGTLTLYAGASPVANIGIDTRPYEPGSDELLGCSDSWVGQTMQRVKHRAAPCQWDKRALCSCGRVTVGVRLPRPVWMMGRTGELESVGRWLVS